MKIYVAGTKEIARVCDAHEGGSCGINICIKH